MTTAPEKQNTLIINGRKREKFTWANGRTQIRQYDKSDRLIEESYDSGELGITVGYQFNGWRSESYRWQGVQINRRDYEARRLEHQDLPASLGYPDIANDDVMSISYQEATGFRVELYRTDDGAASMQFYLLGQDLQRASITCVMASGKQVTDTVQPQKLFRHEMHLHPVSGIELLKISSEFRNDVLVAQRYVVKGKAATRDSYEKARQDFPDISAADYTVTDEQAELAQMIKEGRAWARQEKKNAQRKHQPDSERAHRHDAFCEGLVRGGEQADIWIARPRNTISIKSRRASVAFIRKLYALGAEQVYVCDIEDGVGAGDNSSDLVIRLPASGSNRAALLDVASDISQKEGFDPVLDDGQNLQYLKMD